MVDITRRSEGSLLRGTLTTFRRRCGKPTCRCATGGSHESPALTYTEGGRTRTVTLADAEVAEVSAALARFTEARQSWSGRRTRASRHCAPAGAGEHAARRGGPRRLRSLA